MILRFHARSSKSQPLHTILNEQDPHNFYKSLQLIDLNINTINERYEYIIHLKNAITNVQVKPSSGHDPKSIERHFHGIPPLSPHYFDNSALYFFSLVNFKLKIVQCGHKSLSIGENNISYIYITYLAKNT